MLMGQIGTERKQELGRTFTPFLLLSQTFAIEDLPTHTSNTWPQVHEAASPAGILWDAP